MRFPASRLRQLIVSAVLEPLTLRLADGVYGVCRWAAYRHYVQANARRHFGVVYNGAEPRGTRMPPSSARRILNLPDEGPVAICVARASREKGIDGLLDALRETDMRDYPRTTLVWVGDGPDLDLLKSGAKELSSTRLICVGRQVNIDQWLDAADIFVLPSLHENHSLALLEAMAAGLPVVATNVGGNVETVIDGVTGLLVPPADPVALGEAMRRLIADPAGRSAMGTAGRHRVELHFTIRQQAECLHNVYEQMLQSC